MKVHWVKVPSDNPIGNHVGYAKANGRMLRAFSRICDVGDDGDIALHFLHPLWFSPIEGKRNVLYTMFESDDQDYYIDIPDTCDLIITPSEFCREIFERVTDVPVKVCNLGVDPSVFSYVRRKWNPASGERFRWLFLGAPNPRKYSILEEVHKVLLSRIPDRVELYIKTTGADMAKGLAEIGGREVSVEGDVVKAGNWTVDNRFLPTGEIVDLLHSAHGFLALHMGEGWGQNLLEAMCTGLPCVVSDYSSTQEFANKWNSYPIPVEIRKTDISIGAIEAEQMVKIDAATPDIFRAMESIVEIMDNYGKARKVGRRAAATASKKTWDNSARRLKSILIELDSPRSYK